jgi:thiol:disulfide interchange protein DsbD
LAAFLPPETSMVDDEGITISNDYDEGLALARKAKKKVLLDFSGYGCVNCRKMESTVLRDERVINAIAKDYVVVRLFVDDRKLLPQPIVVNWSGKQRVINTYGEKWSHLESETFKSIAQPFYIILSEKGERISVPFGYDEDTEKFLKWLNTQE